MFFLALSGVFWLMMTLNETYEKEVEIPVRIVNVPKNVVLTSDELDTVKVTLRDKGLMLISYLYGEGMRPLTINFKTYAKGNGYSAIPASELQRLIYQQLSASTKIVGSKPDKLEIFFNYGLSKRVPVKWTGRVIPEHLYFISHVEYFPDSVSIYASQEKLDSIKVIYTEQLNYANFRDTLSVTCKLQKIRGVKAVPDRVKVAFHTDVLTEESISYTISYFLKRQRINRIVKLLRKRFDGHRHEQTFVCGKAFNDCFLQRSDRSLFIGTIIFHCYYFKFTTDYTDSHRLEITRK